MSAVERRLSQASLAFRDRRGWTQGADHRQRYDSRGVWAGGEYSLFGALVLFGEPCGDYDGHEGDYTDWLAEQDSWDGYLDDVGREALECITTVLLDRYGGGSGHDGGYSCDPVTVDVNEFNDHPATTLADVLIVCDAALELARRPSIDL